MADSSGFFQDMTLIWVSGGWLMIPLFLLAVALYYTALKLFLNLQFHFLIRARVYDWSDKEIAERISGRWRVLWDLLDIGASTAREVKRHFEEIHNEYLSPVNRRIKFLAVLIAVGPLIGLLGTVTGMLSTFSGMAASHNSRLDSVVTGISEALITTQTGLIISIPGLVLLSLIVQRRNLLQRAILRLERYNTYWMLHVEWLFPEPENADQTPTLLPPKENPPATQNNPS